MNFRKYFKKKSDTEYWIPISDIVITYDFQLKSPNSRSFGERYIISKNMEFLEKLS